MNESTRHQILGTLLVTAGISAIVISTVATMAIMAGTGKALAAWVRFLERFDRPAR